MADTAVRSSIQFIFRGRVVELDDVSPRKTLLDWLRHDVKAVGTKEGCNEGDCGACTIVLARLRDGRLVHEPVNACILLLGQIDGAELITVEDLAVDHALHPVQAAMVEQHGSQCGFCTPGIVMSLFALHQDGARPVTRAAIADQLAGNLCRCTGYRPIVDAALTACADDPAGPFVETAAAREAALAALDAETSTTDVFIGSAARFFAAPASMEAAAALFADHPEAVVVAGATDVGLWITKGLMDVAKTIWLGRIAGFAEIRDSADQLYIAAGASLAAAMPALAAIDPDIGAILRRFGSVQVRASGTVGGSIANASPIGDLAPMLLALGASVELRHRDVSRTLPLESFFIDYRKQDRAPGELVTGLLVPKLAAAHVFRAYKVAKRFDEDISAVMAAFRFEVLDRRVSSARLAFGGMAAIPKRATQAERAAAGLHLDDESSWQGALSALAFDLQPISDMRASAEYRALVARNLLRKALVELRDASAQTRLIDQRSLLDATE